MSDVVAQLQDIGQDLYNQFLELPLGVRVAGCVGAAVAAKTFVVVSSYAVWRIQDSSKPFNSWTTNDEAIAGMDLSGQLVIVTGANNGIGLETTRTLAKQGAKVIMACRSIKKGEDAKQKILASLPSNSSDLLEVADLDLSSLEKVRQFAKKINERNEKINILINNAGIMALPEYRTSADGYELQFATNHLGHFYLTNLLLPSLLKKDDTSGGTTSDGADSSSKNKRKPRVISLSSIGHRRAGSYRNVLNVFKKTLQSKTYMPPDLQSTYTPFYSYGISKLSNMLFARELQKRYASELVSVSLHPGAVYETGLSKEMSLSTIIGFGFSLLRDPSILYYNSKSILQGAATTLRCVSMTDDEIVRGGYYENCDIFDSKLPRGAARDSKQDNGVLSDLLWQLSEVLCDVKGFKMNQNGN